MLSLASALLVGITLQDSPGSRAAAIVAKLTLEEKISLLAGGPGNYSGNLPAIPRLGVPQQRANDGPQGYNGIPGTQTSFPCALSVAASWDTAMAATFGETCADEFMAKGANIMLGPALNVARVPLDGRNFEYLSGEDPALGAAMAAAVVSAVQSKGIVAVAKHFINNNQETSRFTVNEVVDERSHMQLYMPPFEAAAKAKVGSVMCSYNKLTVLGKAGGAVATWACENPDSLTKELKDRIGFGGYVMSDWRGTHSTVASAMAGLDQEMGDNGFYWGKKLAAAVQAGSVPVSAIDEKVQRILTSLIQVGVFDRPPSKGTPAVNVTTAEHRTTARRIAAAGTVLLKNEGGLLPLPRNMTGMTIAVLGSAADDDYALNGGGSSYVQGSHYVTYLQAVRAYAERVGAKVILPDGKTGKAAGRCAAAADIALVFLATWSDEGEDRLNLRLDLKDDSLIGYVGDANKRSILVLTAPGAVVLGNAMANVASALVTFMPGQEAGNAIADVLWGDVNPSAKLPLTFPNVDNEVNFSRSQYPGVGSNATQLTSTFTERLEVGYRWYHAHRVKPLFAFGHGLSYTSFGYAWGDSSVPPARQGGHGAAAAAAAASRLVVRVTNTGLVPGQEVIQLYLSFPATAGEPPRQLKHFTKVALQPGASKDVAFALTPRDVSIWDVDRSDWALARGKYLVEIGGGSDDIRLQTTVQQ
jgi:beta-glucosidase